MRHAYVERGIMEKRGRARERQGITTGVCDVFV
jgi:hypothetical protein